MRERDLEEWMRKAQLAYPDDPEARMAFVERMRNLVYGLMGEPEPTNTNDHLIQDSRVDWQRVYNRIAESIEENRRWEEQNNGI
jgi:hypothetical protein